MIDPSPVVTCRSPVFGITVEESVCALQKESQEDPALASTFDKWLTNEQNTALLAQRLSHYTLTTKIRFPKTSEVSPPQIGKRQRMKQQNLERMLSKTNCFYQGNRNLPRTHPQNREFIIKTLLSRSDLAHLQPGCRHSPSCMLHLGKIIFVSYILGIYLHCKGTLCCPLIVDLNIRRWGRLTLKCTSKPGLPRRWLGIEAVLCTIARFNIRYSLCLRRFVFTKPGWLTIISWKT
jgi:hypothetical protein